MTIMLHLWGSRKPVDIDPTKIKAVLPSNLGDGFVFSELIDWDGGAKFVAENPIAVRSALNNAIHSMGKKWWIKGVEE